ncbi:MAG: hypothetical protein J6S67_06830 [Methanobrevibacter sp.]|nr:hypothetical protein [Methanobrevibacter sp.]
MAGITGQAQQNLLNSIFGAIDTTSNVANDYITKEARLATTQKKLQLQMDVNDKLLEISRNGKWQDWNKEINDFFEQKKSEMSNPDSPYYCKNNLQGQMFDEALNDSLVNVSNRVAQMAVQRQGQQMQVDNEKAKENARNLGMSGLEYYNFANSLDDAEEELNLLTPAKKEEKRKNNFYIGYTDEQNKLFDTLSQSAVNADKDFNDVWNTIKSNQSKMNGIEEGINTDDIDLKQKKTLEAKYKSMIIDMQNKNAEKLAAVVQALDQETTEEGIVKQALLGQSMMNNMQGNKLSESQRLRYSEYFKLAIGGGIKGSNSGSGSNKPTNSFESLIKAAPDTALQLWLEGKNGNVYDVTQTVSNAVTEQWFTKPYRENFGKSEDELKEDYALMYQGKTSSETITDAITKKVLERFPSAKNYIDNNFKNLITDMQKNPKKYGTATAGELANFMLDTIYSADSSYTDEDFMEAFKQHVNDCYVERIKYVELDKKGNLEKKFNANKEGDIAKAARLASEKDFVYTFNGNEVWAPGKKEALEAEGGIVDVLKNAVAGTLDIPAEDRGKVGFQYVQSKDDMTSQPVITYKNQAFEVIPNDDDKGFKLREVHTGEVIEGKLAGNGKAARNQAKSEAKYNVNAAHSATNDIEEKRINDTNTTITESKEMPKAMAGAGGVRATEWETGDQTTRQIYLQDTVNKIDKDAEKIKKNKKDAMSQDDFYKKYGIRYYDWSQTSEKTARYNLILNSK